MALFVNRQHDGMGRRIDIKPDDVGQLGGNAGIARALEGAQPAAGVSESLCKRSRIVRFEPSAR